MAVALSSAADPLTRSLSLSLYRTEDEGWQGLRRLPDPRSVVRSRCSRPLGFEVIRLTGTQLSALHSLAQLFSCSPPPFLSLRFPLRLLRLLLVCLQLRFSLLIERHQEDV